MQFKEAITAFQQQVPHIPIERSGSEPLPPAETPAQQRQADQEIVQTLRGVVQTLVESRDKLEANVTEMIAIFAAKFGRVIDVTKEQSPEGHTQITLDQDGLDVVLAVPYSQELEPQLQEELTALTDQLRSLRLQIESLEFAISQLEQRGAVEANS